MIYGSKNKGDWGEIYTLIYLIGERVLYSADENLNKVTNVKFPIIKTIRDEKIPVPSKNHPVTNHIEFVLAGVKNVEIYVNSDYCCTLSSETFQDEAKSLMRDILDDNSHTEVSNGMFNIPHSMEFINSIHCQRLAAASDDITDINLVIHDIFSGMERNVGFSVKSYLGGAPTLLNASSATNFVYKVNGISDEQMAEINSINGSKKIIDRLKCIYSLGGFLEYYKTDNNIFSKNLRKMDADIERILAESLLIYYKENIKKCEEVIKVLEANDPLKCEINGIYEYKFKRFLCAKALGLEPSKIWSGEDDANGGYIVTKSNGEVLAYHLYDRDKFKAYLYHNTHFEKGSTSKHKFASIYEVNGQKYINLNLQIRFY